MAVTRTRKRAIAEPETASEGNAIPIEPVPSPERRRRNPELLHQVRELREQRPEGWGEHVVYCYRVEPVLDKAFGSRYVFNVKLSEMGDEEAFDENYVKEQCGSGKYSLMLNDPSGANLATKMFAIDDPAAPPIVATSELTKNPRNAKWFAKNEGEGTTSKGSSETRAALEFAREVITSKGRERGLNEALSSLLLGQAQHGDRLAEQLVTHAEKLSNQPATPSGGDPVTTVDRAADLIKKLTPTPAAAVDPLIALRAAVELLKEVRPATAAPAKTPTEQVAEMVGLIKALREIAPEAAPVADGGGGLATFAAIFNSPVITILGQTIANALAPRGQGSPAPHAQGFAPQPGAGVPASAPPAGPSAPSSVSPIPPEAIAFAEILTDPLMRWMYDDRPGPEAGSAFAELVRDTWGIDRLQMIQSFGPAAIIDLYRASPLWIILGRMEARF